MFHNVPYLGSEVEHRKVIKSVITADIPYMFHMFHIIRKLVIYK